jgi:tetratricopeptide (TPR) repeat protein
MAVQLRMRRKRIFLVALVCASFSSCFWAYAQQTTLGSVVGHIRIVRGDTPPRPVLVSIEVHGAPMESVYSDASGTFGFHGLPPDPYYVVVNDENYEAVRRLAVIDPATLSPTVYLDISLIPKKIDKEASENPRQPAGSNPNLVDIREYSERFPKAAVKEFTKGLSADRSGRREEAIRHYQKAITIAPDFYIAHNNLGSDFVSKSDFVAARNEFEQVVRLNHSDADAFFNLSNVCMLTGHLADAQHYLDEGLRRQPESAVGQFFLGSLNIRLKKLPEAEDALRKAIQLDPQMAQPRLQLVNLLLQLGRKSDAESLLRDFLSAFPENSFSTQARQVLQRLESASKVVTPPN